MVVHLSKNASPYDIQNLSECANLCMVGGASLINITVELSDVEQDWSWFERIVFLANLLEVNGVFVLGNLLVDIESNEIHTRIENLYAHTIFADSEIIFTPANADEDRSYPRRVVESEKRLVPVEKTKIIRSIVVWEGYGVIRKDRKFILKLAGDRLQAKVLEVQKILLPDFSGSIFGVHEVEFGQIATVTFALEKAVENHYYHDNQSKGMFLLRNQYDDSKMGFGIRIKE